MSGAFNMLFTSPGLQRFVVELTNLPSAVRWAERSMTYLPKILGGEKVGEPEVEICPTSRTDKYRLG